MLRHWHCVVQPGPAAVYINCLPGHVARVLAREETHDRSDVSAIAKPTERRTCKNPIPIVFIAEQRCLIQFRHDRARTNSLESLDSISVDIARMIDHDAALELWDRYRRGESNVFTRRLYTLQGQQTFDEIRRKYGRDEEFRQTVDRYVEEFERLLAEVSRDDRDSMLTKTYLTSETGKVYTMLAHASGRFD